MSPIIKGRLGDRLIDKGWITPEQLDLALGEQRRAHRPLGEILLSLSFVSDEKIASLLAEDLGLPFKHASEVSPDPLLCASVDADFVRQTQAFPVRLEAGALQVLMADPDDPQKVSIVRKRFPYTLEIAVTTETDLLRLVRSHLPREEGRVAELFTVLDDPTRTVEDFPVERMTNAVLLDGIHRGAADVHVEPDERVTRVRYRIDGILRQGENLPAKATAAIVSRIKILAGLDISERRRPQDGRIRMNVDERNVDMRVSVMPCAHGENVVVRILDRASGGTRLQELGLSPTIQRHLHCVTERSHGLFLVTGPTGSGKTTTLYSMLQTVDAVRRNVATIEDPIEFQIPLLRQSQIDPSIGFGFAEGLRSLLRQDPDVILVGEIRDFETADMAVKASMTGHLVFSTLHTNTSFGAVPRLSDIGVDPFLIEDALIGVLAQRLVRTLCALCSEPTELSAADRAWLGDDVGKPKSAHGCDRCAGTGFAGRIAITELFLPDDAIAEAIHARASAKVLYDLACKRGFRSMEDDGKDKVRAGLTTRQEVMRVNHGHRLTEDELEDV